MDFTNPEFFIQTGALGILAYGSMRMFSLFSNMNETLKDMTLLLGELLGKRKAAKSGKARA